MQPNLSKDKINSEKKTVKSLKLNKKQVPDNFQNFSDSIFSTGQLIIVALFGDEFGFLDKHYFSCNFSVIDFEEKKQFRILSTLNLLVDFKSNNYLEYFLVFNFFRIGRKEEAIAYFIENQKKYKQVNCVYKKFKKALEKNNKEICVTKFSDIVDNTFLEIRKNFLLDLFNDNNNINKKILLDPEFELQPVPSVDAIFFKINKRLSEMIQEKQIKGFSFEMHRKKSTNKKMRTILFSQSDSIKETNY